MVFEFRLNLRFVEVKIDEAVKKVLRKVVICMNFRKCTSDLRPPLAWLTLYLCATRLRLHMIFEHLGVQRLRALMNGKGNKRTDGTMPERRSQGGDATKQRSSQRTRAMRISGIMPNEEENRNEEAHHHPARRIREAPWPSDAPRLTSRGTRSSDLSAWRLTLGTRCTPGRPAMDGLRCGLCIRRST